MAKGGAFCWAKSNQLHERDEEISRIKGQATVAEHVVQIRYKYYLVDRCKDSIKQMSLEYFVILWEGTTLKKDLIFTFFAENFCLPVLLVSFLVGRPSKNNSFS